MKINIKHYTYRITWSAEDNEYVGLCTEFPSLSWLDKSPEKALSGIQQLISRVIKDMEKSKEEIPQPFSEKKYSGEFRVRIPPELHRNLALQAAEQGVSLNRIASLKLAN